MNSSKAGQELQRKASIYGGLLAPVALAFALGVSAAAQVAEDNYFGTTHFMMFAPAMHNSPEVLITSTLERLRAAAGSISSTV